MYSEIPSEVELSFIEDLHLLDLVNYAHVGRKSRTCVESLLTLRSVKLLLPFFSNDEMKDFWDALDSGEGGLTGSAPVWMTQGSPSWNPLDLNAMAAASRGHYVRRFLLKHGWNEDETTHRVPNVLPARSFTHLLRSYSPGSPSASTTSIFRKKGHNSITLTETAGETIFGALAGAKHSMATMLLTSTTIIALHPYDCVNKYYTFRAGAAMPRDEHSAAAARAYKMGGSEAFFHEIRTPCGRKCPGVLRRLRGGDGLGLFRWNAKPSAELSTVAYAGFMDEKFSIGWTWAKCRNSRCATFGFPRDLVSTLPKSVKLLANVKENQLLRTVHAIEHCSPPFPCIHNGMLFATSCSQPFVVPVPLDHGRVNYHTVDDLRAYTWITPRIAQSDQRPALMMPYEVVGSTSVLRNLGWKGVVDVNLVMLVFMASVEAVGPVNNCLAATDTSCRAVHGDVLLMLESYGSIVDVTTAHSDSLKEAFKRGWKTLLESESLGSEELRSI